MLLNFSFAWFYWPSCQVVYILHNLYNSCHSLSSQLKELKLKESHLVVQYSIDHNAAFQERLHPSFLNLVVEDQIWFLIYNYIVCPTLLHHLSRAESCLSVLNWYWVNFGASRFVPLLQLFGTSTCTKLRHTSQVTKF